MKFDTYTEEEIIRLRENSHKEVRYSHINSLIGHIENMHKATELQEVEEQYWLALQGLLALYTISKEKFTREL